ncbi:MAG: DNA mismatch repair endonuclease MutL [Syntrophaceae bacterium]
MSKITVLPREVSDRIAAGEVIERPASIIKELLENSLDAGADEVSIAIEKGGKESIRIVDNGEGMDADDLKLAFMRHSTSKIRDFDDLMRIRSYGFRGEALSSIASVSRMEIMSRTARSQAGSRIVIENGEILEMGEAGSPPGTAISVSKIFSAVPARKKFLRSDKVEQGHCLDAITRTALARENLRVQVASNGKTLLHMPRAESLAERAGLVMGPDFSRSCLPFGAGRNGIKVSGLLSGPGYTRSNSRAIMFYVNGRFIKDNLLHHALMGAYKKLIEPGRYPSAVVLLEIPSGEVDVNVHPAKTEVRFGNSSEVYDLLRSGAADALSRVLPGRTDIAPDRIYRIYGNTGGDARGDVRREGSEGHPASVQEQKAMFSAPRSMSRKSAVNIDLTNLLKAVEEKRQAEKGNESEPQGYFSGLEYIGQYAGTYLIFSERDGLVLVDQHAAHERVLFERLRAAAREDNISSQTLLIPEVINLSVADAENVLAASESLNSIGFAVEPFGDASIAVRAVPAVVGGLDVRDIMESLAARIAETGRAKGPGAGTEDWREDIFAFLACRAAIKANRELDDREISALCRDLDSIPFASNCPHGRPVFIHFSHREIERMFRRA